MTTSTPMATLARLHGAAIAAVCLAWTPVSWAQGTHQVPASTAEINPLTGQSLSSEGLARELARLKIEAELSETRLKLAKSQADLALATLRQEAEEKRLRSEVKTGTPSLSLDKLPTGLIQGTPAKVITPNNRSRATSTTPTEQDNTPIPVAAANPPAKPISAQGHIIMGTERIAVAALAAQDTARVNAVDAQPVGGKPGTVTARTSPFPTPLPNGTTPSFMTGVPAVAVPQLTK